MNLIRRFLRYIVPSVNPEISEKIDRMSMHNIHKISMIILGFEGLSLAVFLVAKAGSFGHNEIISTICVTYCLLMCGLAVFFSKKMMEKKDLTRNECITFKVFFFIAFSLWAIFTDYRHY